MMINDSDKVSDLTVGQLRKFISEEIEMDYLNRKPLGGSGCYEAMCKQEAALSKETEKCIDHSQHADEDKQYAAMCIEVAKHIDEVLRQKPSNKPACAR